MQAWELIHKPGGPQYLMHRESQYDIGLFRVTNLDDVRREIGRAGDSRLLSKAAVVELVDHLTIHAEKEMAAQRQRDFEVRVMTTELRSRICFLLGRLAADERTGEPPKAGTRWGKWTFTGEEVVYGDNQLRIGLHELMTADQVGEKTKHIQYKPWPSDDDLLQGLEAIVVSSRASTER